MDSKKTNKEQKLEKELKTLVSRMKNENAALSKILVQLTTKDDKQTVNNENAENQQKSENN